MPRLANYNIGVKLLLVTVLTTAFALFVAGIVIVTYQNVDFRAQKLRESSVQAEILAQGVSASLAFNDSKTAMHYLNALKANPEIVAAGAYGSDGTLVSSYTRDEAPSHAVPQRSETPGHRFEGDELLMFWAVKENQRQLGTVFLRLSLEPVEMRLTRYGSLFFLVMVGALLLALPLATRLYAGIAGPLRSMAEVSRRVAAGDLTVQLAVEERNDEIGVLGESFSRMLAGLRETTRQLGEGAEVLATSTAEILASSTQVASGSAQTATALGQTGVTVEEVKQTARQAAQQASQVTENMRRTADTARTGREAVEKSIEAMGRIQGQMESVAESMVRLSEQGQAIGEIIATVSDLAEQSNMLAVNAAIEAAKAGEQGKGFAVVAQEVKSLAEQSKQATTQVRGILGDIQRASNSAVLATEQVGKVVDEGVRLSAEGGAAIRSLAESMAAAVQAAAQIAASAQEQQVGMDQVALAMKNIRDASAQNVSSTRQAESAAQNLHQLGMKLKDLVGQYRS